MIKSNNIISISKNKITVKFMTNLGKEKVKSIIVKNIKDLQDLITYLDTDDDIEFIFNYFENKFGKDPSFTRIKEVWRPRTAKELLQQQINKKNREKYYESYEFELLEKENQRQIKIFIGELNGLK